MPVVPFIPLIAAGVGAAATIYTSNAQRSSAQQGLNAQLQANQQGVNLQQQNRAEDAARQEPWRQFGLQALNQLAQVHGFTSPVTPQGQPGPSTFGEVLDGTPDYAGYVARHPDLQEAYRNDDRGLTPAQFGQWHYETHGRNETDRVGPAYAAQPTPQPASTPAVAQPANANAPAGSDPRFAGFFASPDYAFRTQEGLRAITGNAAARGLLDSGATGKALIQYGQESGSAEYGNWYNRLAQAAGIGQTVNQNLAASGQATANNVTGLLQNSAAARSTSYQQQGAANAGMVSGLAGIATGLIQNYGAPRGYGSAPQTSPWGDPLLSASSSYRAPAYGPQI